MLVLFCLFYMNVHVIDKHGDRCVDDVYRKKKREREREGSV